MPPTPPRPALPLAWTQLAVATVGLCVALSVSYLDEEWDQLPAPLVATACAAATFVLLSLGRIGGALTAALLPATVHVVAAIKAMPVDDPSLYGTWTRHTFTRPFGDLSTWSFPSAISDMACMIVIAVGVAVAVRLIRSPHRPVPSHHVSPGPPILVATLAGLGIAVSLTGEKLGQNFHLPTSLGLAAAAVTAAVLSASVDAYTRRADGGGKAISAGVSGALLLVPLGWLVWPQIESLAAPPSQGFGIGIVGLALPRWFELAHGLSTLGELLIAVAVALTTLMAAQRAAAIKHSA